MVVTPAQAGVQLVKVQIKAGFPKFTNEVQHPSLLEGEGDANEVSVG